MKKSNKNKISRYSLIGINNISSSYVQSISNMGLIDRMKEREYAANIIDNRNMLIQELFGTPYISELFLKHFQKTRSSIIHAKYIFELSKYVTHSDNEDSSDSGDDFDIEEKKEDKKINGNNKQSKKNIFNDINNIINTIIKKSVDNIVFYVNKIKLCKDKDQHIGFVKCLGESYSNIYLHENIVKEMYQIYINHKNEIDTNNTVHKVIFGLSIDEFNSRYTRIRTYYKNVLLYTEKMILSNLRLVISVSKKYVNKRTDFMDIVQEGNLGLVKAIKKFDYSRGYKFSTYATWWIKQAITRDMYEKCDPVRIPIHMKENISKVFKNLGSISDDLSYDEKIKEVAKQTLLDEKKIRKVFKIQRGYVSLDRNSGSHESDNEDAVDFIDYRNNVTPFNYVVMKDKRRIIEELICDLNEREKDIFRLRFMDHKYRYDREMTLEMIGYLKGITRERVRQIIHKIILRLLCNNNNEKYKDILFN